MRESRSAHLNRLGNQHFARGFYTDAYYCYARALEADRQSGDRRALAATLGNLGNICAVSGRRDQAQDYYVEVLELQKILGDERGISTTLANLGNLYADAGEWDRARAYYLEALDLMNQVADHAAKAILLSDLGLVARENCQFDQALLYYEESLTLMRRVGNEAGQADVYRARLYIAQDRYDEALACTQTSLAIAERLRDELRMGGAWYVIAGCYEARGQLAEAISFLEQVVRVDQKFHLPKLEENTKRLQTLRERSGPQEKVECE
jgi:tetratricopeptide (TPR) repeat protein